ncbi:MAG: nucleotidyltransferase domain-containing protein [Chloroflexia bacterium]|nr:nucleotidyltransferase domain-containing protein [Chloroflexia bacterium]
MGYNLPNTSGHPRSLPRAELVDWFSRQPSIRFALLFGSFSQGTMRPQSDVDLAIYTQGELALLERGAWTTELEQLCRRTVDLVWLNPLPAQNPALAFEILASGELLFCPQSAPYVAYKTRAILRYLDTTYLRQQVEDAFQNRHIHTSAR